MSYLPIENYGIIGDMNTIALVGLDGSIDFMCFPDFGSPTIFAALLDDKKGGRFTIAPEFAKMKTKQLYLPDTNVLLTRFLSEDGVGEVTDFMPVKAMSEGGELIRRITTVRGRIEYKMFCMPRLNYALDTHRIEKKSENEILFTNKKNPATSFYLKSSVPLQIQNGDATASFALSPNETADFIFGYNDESSGFEGKIESHVSEKLSATVNYWKDWVAQSNYNGHWRAMVRRSALVLKLLSSKRYGSIVAAATFGLPEKIGGERNWDYRYVWIRDASFSVYSLVQLGYTQEAGAFMQWVEKQCQDIKGKNRLGILYAIDGTRQLKEGALEHFEGYMKSSPVRTGNDAYSQLQLDIYGELMDAVYLYDKHGDAISYDFWKNLERQIDWLSENWQRPGEGIWEVRGGSQHFLFSRLMSWVAFDRAIKIGDRRSFPLNENWKKVRDEIFKSIFSDFWNAEKQAFVQYPGSTAMDASAMLMPLTGFISAKDPRWLSTLERIEKELITDSLVYRYDTASAAPDGFTGPEGTFSVCTFWYVECLALSGQLEKARFYFEKMLGYANHLGLYSEQLGFEGQHLGNFPQTYTHTGLIGAAFNLNRQLEHIRNKTLNY